MSDLDIAKFLTNQPNYFTPVNLGSRDESTSVRHGWALSGVDEDGYVQVILDGDYQLVGGDDDDPETLTEIDESSYESDSIAEVKTSEYISEGQRVSVIKQGGVAKAIALTPDTTGYTELREAIESLEPASTAHLWVQETATADVPAGAYVTVDEYNEANPAAALNGGFVQITTASVGIGSGGIVTSTFDSDSIELANGLATLEGNEWGGYILYGKRGGVVTSTKDMKIGGDSGIVFRDERPDPVWNDENQEWVIPQGADDAVTYLSINARSIKMSGYRFAPLSAHDTDWQYLTGNATSTNYLRWRCRSGIVFIEINYANSAGVPTASSNAKTFGTIPSGYRPTKSISSVHYSGSNNVGCLWIETDGKVKANTRASSAQSAIYGTLTYPLSQSIIVEP